MSAPLQTSGAPLESQTWQELEDVFATLGQLARSPVAPHEFYRTVLDQSVRALSAIGGAAWLRTPSGAMQPVVQTGWAGSELVRNEQMRRAHEVLLLRASSEGRVISVAPNSASEDHADAANPTEHLLLFGPVNVSRDESQTGQRDGKAARDGGTTLAIIELWVRGDASPATYRGGEQFLMAVCELCADYHAFNELRRLRQDEHHHAELLEFGQQVHADLNLKATAYAVANEGRRVVDCDRLSVFVARGRRCRLLAASGITRAERRSSAVKHLEKLAALVQRTDEPAYYADGECDALPPVGEAITRLVEDSHARHVAAIPLRQPGGTSTEDSALLDKRSRSRRRSRPQFVLIAEQFDSRGGELRRDWLVEAAQVCTTALYNAREADRLPFGWLLRPLGKVSHWIAVHLPRTLLLAAAIAGAIYALVMVQADFNIEAPGTMQPTVRRDVFAPRSGVVDEVLVKHGTNVAAGDPLVKMRDPALELELKRVDGEMETAQRQLDAVRATKTNRAIRDTNPVDAYRLSAEEREIEQTLTNLRRELDLLKHEREQLVVTSPISGRVLTWDVGHQLSARPVERGEVLVTVADLSAEWQLELEVPDDRMGYVLEAQKRNKPDLPVRFRLGSEERAEHVGTIAEVCQTAEVPTEQTTRPSPKIITKVSLDSKELISTLGGELRPGVSARAQIECGQRSLGYVWLHDIWDAAIEWWEF